MSIVLKKHEDITSNEIFASLKTANFSNFIEEIEEVDTADIVLKDIESDTEREGTEIRGLGSSR